MNDRLKDTVFDIFDNGFMRESMDILTSDPRAGVFAGSWSFVNQLYRFLVPLATLLIVVALVLRLIENTMKGTDYTRSDLFKEVALFFIMTYVINNGLVIISNFFSAGYNFLQRIDSTVLEVDSEGSAESIWNALLEKYGTDYNLDGVMDRIDNTTSLMFLITIFPIKLVNFFISMAVKAMSYLYIFKLYVKFLMFPFSLPETWRRGYQNGKLFRYLYSFFKLILQGAFMILALNIGSNIINNVSLQIINSGNNFAVLLPAYLGVQLSVLIVFFKAEQMSNSLL